MRRGPEVPEPVMSRQLALSEAKAPSRFGRVAFLAPIVLFVGLAAVLGYGLTRDRSVLPSALIGKPVPRFDLAPVMGRSLGLSSENLKGEVSLVNFFASWCVACRYEHPIFLQLKQTRVVPIHGIDYKDHPEAAAAWLDQLGDPYTRTGADLDGRVGIDWGIAGVPETFVIDRQGRVAYKQIGPITQEVLDDAILPLVERLQQ